jgi:hypothetical protein
MARTNDMATASVAASKVILSGPTAAARLRIAAMKRRSSTVSSSPSQALRPLVRRLVDKGAKRLDQVIDQIESIGS